MRRRLIIVAICIAILVPLSIGYNLDLGSYIRHTGEPGSMFGFSIALHKAHRMSWVVIGAPKGDTSKLQPGVTKGGAVFRCEILDDDRCYMIPFDSKGNQKNLNGEQIDTKSHQWLGATIASSSDSNIVVACAPRYVFHQMQPKRVERIEPVGTCFTSTNFTSFTEFAPCRSHQWGYHRHGHCEAGFSAALSKTGDRLYIGAPGAWYWQGQVWSINTEARYPYKPQWGQDFGTGGAVFSQDIGNPKHNVFHTRESSEPYDDSYLGYSMTMGDFDGDGEEDVAIGMPRGSQLMGRIVINRWNMENIVNITGWQLGAYFGYSVAAVDVDGDKLTDLIIGAPMYTQPNNEGKYEVGRVYILLQTRQKTFKSEIYRDGVGNKGRFGLSLAGLGDINLDGYGDFAVGAPYDGPYGRGAVYIYHGSNTGPLEKPSQVIYAEDLVGTNIPKTFGFSLSGGVDMDDNAYPDVAVGAYDSDSVFIFKSRPVAIIDASTQFTSASKLISLDEKRCTLYRYGKQVPCTDVESCIRYDGKNLPPILDFEVSWVLDSKKTRNPRMFFLRDENKNHIRNSTYRLERGKRFCVNETVYLVEGIRDKLTPLEVEMRYQLRGNRNRITTRRKRELLEPVIDQNREIIQRDSINIQKNCGSDNICIPDLRLNIETVDKFLLGSKEPLSIKVFIANSGEDAFEAGFYLTVPENLYYKRWEPISNVKDVPITCSGPSLTSNNTVKCDLGNPLPSNKVVEFKVVFIPTHKSGMSPSYDFYMEANSTNAEIKSSSYDNIIKRSIAIWIETEIQIEGNSFPSETYYNADEFKSLEAAKNESELGPHIAHLYNIRNNGTSIIDEAVVFIHYPFRTEGNDTLLYLLDQPETSRNIQCEKSINANPYNLILDRNLQNIYNLVNLTGTTRSSAQHQIHVEIPNYPSSTSAVSRTKVLTADEKKKLSEEENQESEGDASYIHKERQRANDVSVASASFGGVSSNPVVYKVRNRTTYYDRTGLPHVIESSTEFYNPRDIEMQYSGNRDSGYNTQRGSDSLQDQHHIVYNSQNRFDDKSIGAGQGGFRAGMIDLGTSSRNSPDSELQKQITSGRYHQPQDYRPGGYHQQSASWSSQDPGLQTEYHDFQDNTNHYEYADNRQHQNTDNRQYQQSDNRQYQHSDNRDYPSQQRGKRELFDQRSPCQAAQCESLRCIVSNLENDSNDGSYILIRMRLLAKTAEKIAPKAPLKISTMAVSHITKLPYIGMPKDDKIKSHEIFYVANPTPEQVPDVVPLWVVILAACAGALILLLLAFLLYKCGFFNRNRPTDHSQERQPLNSRNGYH